MPAGIPFDVHPTWEQRAAERKTNVRTAYWFGLDNGPDNVGFVKRVRHVVGKCPSVMYGTVWCLLHQTHLIVAASLAMVESHELPADPHFL